MCHEEGSCNVGHDGKWTGSTDKSDQAFTEDAFALSLCFWQSARSAEPLRTPSSKPFVCVAYIGH